MSIADNLLKYKNELANNGVKLVAVSKIILLTPLLKLIMPDKEFLEKT